jgi:enoyl-CoA hydratase/carnithine racemase
MIKNRLILLEEVSEGVAKLVLNAPPLNLVTLELTRQLIEALDDLERNDSVRAVVITGAGNKAFCAGSDIQEFPAVWDAVVEKKLARENQAFDRIEFLSKPVVAAIEGIAYGGGCEISMACDIRIIAEDATVGLPEVKLGVVPGSGGMFRLPRLVGPARAMELMYLGNPIDAREAERIGLVNAVVPPGETLPYAIQLAQQIARQPRASISAIRRAVRESRVLPHDEAVRLTLELSDLVFRTDDCREGVEAFTQKRKPKFEGAPEDGPE